MKPIYYLLIFSICCIFSACSNPNIQSQVSTDKEYVGLHKVKGSTFKKFYLNAPNVLNQYHSLRFSSLELNNLKVDQGRIEFRDRNWRVDNKYRNKLSGFFSEQVQKLQQTATSDGFTIIDAAGEGVLDVQYELLEFFPNAPQDKILGKEPSRRPHTSSVGDLLYRVSLVDSASGAPVGLIQDWIEIGDGVFLQENNRAYTARKFKQSFGMMIGQLKETLDKLKAKQPAS